MAGGEKSARERELTSVIEQAVTPEQLVVEDVSITPAGKRRLVRILLDDDLSSVADDDTTSAVPPVNLDRIAEATRKVSEALDASDVMGEAPYVLEVSSPGTDRVLTTRRQLRRNVGRLVTLTLNTTSSDGATPSSLEGRLLAVGADELTLSDGEGERTVPVNEVTGARVQVEFTSTQDHDETAHPDEATHPDDNTDEEN